MADSASDSVSELESESESPMQTLPPLLPQQDRLTSKGYIRLYGYAPLELCDKLLAESIALKPTDWKNLFGSGGMDSKRQTAKAPSKTTKNLFETISDGCWTFFPESVPRDWMFIHSKPGGKDQPVHRDFLPIPSNQDLYDYSRLPGSVMVGLQDNSYIYGYGWNRLVAMEEDKEKITFGKGDVLMFRSDFMHSGGGYSVENTRLHFFLDPAKGDRNVRKKNSIDLLRVIPKKLPADESGDRSCFIYG